MASADASAEEKVVADAAVEPVFVVLAVEMVDADLVGTSPGAWRRAGSCILSAGLQSNVPAGVNR